MSEVNTPEKGYTEEQRQEMDRAVQDTIEHPECVGPSCADYTAPPEIEPEPAPDGGEAIADAGETITTSAVDGETVFMAIVEAVV